MTSHLSESTPTSSAPHTTQIDRITLKRGLIAFASLFVLFFLMGFVSAWLQIDGDLMDLVMQGVKVATSGTLGVICIGVSAKAWQRLPVPAWLPSTASFAVGFFVMNGLGEIFDGRYENILPKAGGGFLIGACVGLGMHLAQKKGWMPRSSADNSERSASTRSGN